MTRVAGCRERGMQPVQREAGLSPVVEPALVKRPQLGVDAGVFDVARNAVGRDVAVDPPLLSDAVGDRFVAGQAPVCRDTLA